MRNWLASVHALFFTWRWNAKQYTFFFCWLVLVLFLPLVVIEMSEPCVTREPSSLFETNNRSPVWLLSSRGKCPGLPAFSHVTWFHNLSPFLTLEVVSDLLIKESSAPPHLPAKYLSQGAAISVGGTSVSVLNGWVARDTWKILCYMCYCSFRT